MRPLSLVLILLPVLAAAPSLDQRVASEISAFQGTVSLYAKNLDTGASFGLREDERVPTASTIKLAIMTAVFQAVADGRAQWTGTLPLSDEDKVSGSGILSELSSGVRLPIRDLVHLMIVVSDNSATNLLLERFTADAVNAQMDKLGLQQIRCLRKIRGDGSNLKPPDGFSRAGKLAANERFGIGVATPRGMVLLLEKIERGEVVDAAASREMIAILKRQQDRNGIARHTGELPVAGKSGALDHLRSDVGIVYTPAGRIAIAITCDDLPAVDYSADNPGLLLISRLTGILIEGLSGKP